jgi:C4-type Zn-finger protein
MVRCKNCKFKFPSFTQMNEVAFETAAPISNVEECPGCKEMLAYSRKDYNIRPRFNEVFLSCMM